MNERFDRIDTNFQSLEKRMASMESKDSTPLVAVTLKTPRAQILIDLASSEKLAGRSCHLLDTQLPRVALDKHKKKQQKQKPTLEKRPVQSVDQSVLQFLLPGAERLLNVKQVSTGKVYSSYTFGEHLMQRQPRPKPDCAGQHLFQQTRPQSDETTAA